MTRHKRPGRPKSGLPVREVLVIRLRPHIKDAVAAAALAAGMTSSQWLEQTAAATIGISTVPPVKDHPRQKRAFN